jgi:hypothetical protein
MLVSVDRLRRVVASKNASLHHALPTRSTLEWPDVFLAPSSSIIPIVVVRSVDAVVAAKPCWPTPVTSSKQANKQEETPLSFHEGKKEPHEKATHETRGNNDTPLFASCTFSSHAIYYKAEISSPSSSSIKSPVDCIAWIGTFTHSPRSPLTNPPPPPHTAPPFGLTVHIRTAREPTEFFDSSPLGLVLSFLSSRYPEVLRASAIL